MDYVIRVLRNPYKLLFGIVRNIPLLNKNLPDYLYLKLEYRSVLGKKLNLEEPVSFNEKLQWLKLNDRKEEYSIIVDKYEVKKYVADKIGEEYIIPTYGVWDNFNEINFDKLPNQFVLKCTHDSGSIIICKDKQKFNVLEAKRKLEKKLKKNFYYISREWPYKKIKPRIIAEKFMESSGKIVPEDYKIYCINGKPLYIVIFHNRFDVSKKLSESMYDTNWNKLDISLDDHFEISDSVEAKPECLSELLTVCEKLCKDFIQIRVDFYILNNQIYFGEMTLYTAGGLQPMIPRELDDILGRKIILPGI